MFMLAALALLVATTGNLAVRVVEGDAAVRLRVAVPAGVDPDSVEVRLDGRSVTVLARDVTGRRLRSSPIVLREAPSESGARAIRRPDGSVTIVLPKPGRVPAPGTSGRPGPSPTP